MIYDFQCILTIYLFIFLWSVAIFGGMIVGYLLFKETKKDIDKFYSKKSKKTN